MNITTACDIIEDLAYEYGVDNFTMVELMVSHWQKLESVERSALITFMDFGRNKIDNKSQIQ